MVVVLGGCSTYPAWIPSSGPSKTQVGDSADNNAIPGIRVIDVTDEVARQRLLSRSNVLFTDVFGNESAATSLINDGDVIEVTVWESPPASLFGSDALDSRVIPSSRAVKLPEQMVNNEGNITVPFAGQVFVRGLTLHQIEKQIIQRLQNIANQPQVVVRLIQNNTSNVTVIGEVASSLRMPLTVRGERLLDAIATAGGVRQSVDKMTVQITRGNKVISLPLETVIKDPTQNIVLQPGDVVTSLYHSMSFSVLGAAGRNEEISFESKGISLAQALARSGGVQDQRADAQGVFIFRFEYPKALGLPDGEAVTPDGKIPVIYRVNLKDPATFFVAQNFPIENKDLLYVSNASAAELQKFLNIVTGSILYPYVSVKSAVD